MKFVHERTDDRTKPLLKIGNNSVIEGQVHAEATVELLGSVYDHISCSIFSYQSPASTYTNHLLDATIDATKLSPYYIGPLHKNGKTTYAIAKWLY